MKRRGPPPARLTWPGNEGASFGSATKNDEYLMNSDESLNYTKSSSLSTRSLSTWDESTRNRRHEKKRKAIHSSSVICNDNGSDKHLMWTDKHVPTVSSELCVQPKKIEEVRDWLKQCFRSIRDPVLYGSCSKLLVLTGGPGVGKSTMCKVLAKELEIEISQWNENQDAPHDFRFRQSQSQLSSFSNFLHSASCYKSLDFVAHSSSLVKSNLLLIEDLPNINGVLDGELKIRNIFSKLINETINPAILIYSDVSEGRVNFSRLETLLDRNLLHSQKVATIHINPATKAKIKKACERIVKRERQNMPKSLMNEIQESSHGDMRSVSLALQFALTGSKGKKISHNSGKYLRDAKLSTFHALGKLLYAKRMSDSLQPGADVDIRPPLAFDPEQVIRDSEMEIDRSLEFLQFHSPNFFANENDLANALSTFSDAAMILERKYRSNFDTSNLFPSEYVCSLASRSVADANKNPAPKLFRSLNAPKIFEIRRKKKDNMDKLLTLSDRLSKNSEHFGLSTNLGLSDGSLVSELTYLSQIVPNGMNMVDKLHIHRFLIFNFNSLLFRSKRRSLFAT